MRWMMSIFGSVLTFRISQSGRFTIPPSTIDIGDLLEGYEDHAKMC